MSVLGIQGLFLTIAIAFVVTMTLSSIIESNRFNKWYNELCSKHVQKLPEKQFNQLVVWIQNNLEASTSVEMRYDDILNSMPAKLRFKLKQRQIRGLMYYCGFEPLGDCFLDPSIFAVQLKDKNIGEEEK